jgi:hypothetical protein
MGADWAASAYDFYSGNPDCGHNSNSIQREYFMMENFGIVLSGCFPILTVILIVLVSTRPVFRGRPFFLTYLIITLITSSASIVPHLLVQFAILDHELLSGFYQYSYIPIVLFSLFGYCLLIPYVLFAGTSDASFPKTKPQYEPNQIP